MSKFSTWGHHLYTGETSLPFIPKKKLWLGLSAALMVVAILIPLLSGGFRLGIDFKGGSEFTVSSTESTDTSVGERAVKEHSGAEHAEVTNIAPHTMRVQTDQLSNDQTLEVKKALQDGYRVSGEDVTSSFVGPTWGEGVTRQATWGLVVFVLLATLGMALYFRTIKMSLASIAGLVFTVVSTAGIYGALGYEITPSAVIGFLTILSYSLYDSVVVFDKIRENTKDFPQNRERTFAQEVNLAVNQTLVRSINTSVVGILPVGAILFIGAYLLGAGTLQDLSLALFIGIILGTLGTLFVAAPLYAALRSGEKGVKEQARRIRENDWPAQGATPTEEPQQRWAEGSAITAGNLQEAPEQEQPVPDLEPEGKGPDHGAVL